MNVLHINTRLKLGGAAIAAERLHSGLKRTGNSSRFIVGYSTGSNDNVKQVPYDWRTKYLHRVLPLSGLNYLEYLGSFKIRDMDFYKSADVVNLHNLHRDYFSYLSLPRLTKNKPTVWTLHDMWAFTGHCAYSFDCERWEAGCGNCPYPKVYPAIKRDATALEWRLKNHIYSNSKITVVTTSRWL